MYRTLVGLLATSALFGQATPSDRLQREASRTRALFSANESVGKQAVQVQLLHAALRDWIESRLPETTSSSGAELHTLEAVLQAELRQAKLSEPASDDIIPGFVGLKFEWLPELPNALAVIASVTVECGADEAFYLYEFRGGTRVLAVEDHPQSSWGFTDVEVQLSDPDSQGRRLLLTHYRSVQCQSTWMVMAYSVYRMASLPGTSELLLTDEHGFWLGTEPEFVLKPQELVVEFLDSSVDPALQSRTRIHRYGFAQGVQRLDPVAILPQDFAEEWLTRDWKEMESRSAGDTKEWHQRLHNDFVGAEYSAVIPCASQDRWMVALDITRIGDEVLTDPPTTYFLVRDLGNHTYRMEAVSTSRPATCSGTGVVNGAYASIEQPWLSTAELKALR
jgi:hypothetical protein